MRYGWERGCDADGQCRVFCGDGYGDGCECYWVCCEHEWVCGERDGIGWWGGGECEQQRERIGCGADQQRWVEGFGSGLWWGGARARWSGFCAVTRWSSLTWVLKVSRIAGWEAWFRHDLP